MTDDTSRTNEQTVRNSFTAGERDLQAYAQRNQDTGGTHSGQNISGGEERTTTRLVDTPNLRDVRRPCEKCKQVRRQERPDVYEPVGSKCLPCRLGNTSGAASERNTGGLHSSQGEVDGEDRLQDGSGSFGLTDASEAGSGLGNSEHDERTACEKRGSDGETVQRTAEGATRPLEPSRTSPSTPVQPSDTSGRLGDTEHDGCSTHSQRSGDVQPSAERRENGQDVPRESEGAGGREESAVLPRRFIGRETWRDNIIWLYCRDEKYRPIKSCIKPLAYGSASRMGFSGDNGVPFDANNTAEARAMRLKGYGNAINSVVAKTFIEAFLGAEQ